MTHPLTEGDSQSPARRSLNVSDDDLARVRELAKRERYQGEARNKFVSGAGDNFRADADALDRLVGAVEAVSLWSHDESVLAESSPAYCDGYKDAMSFVRALLKGTP